VSSLQETPAEAREEARQILEEDRFHETDLPRPLRRPLEWLGEQLDPVGDLFVTIVDAVPGGSSAIWLVLATAVLVAAIFFALSLVRRRGPAARRGPARTSAEQTVDAATLEHEADAAEQAGDLERALRLRFRAGILRLVERRQVEDPALVTTGSLVRRLRSEAFAAGARAFDEVVYGRRVATRDDVRKVREGWQAVLAR
jgi:Domain of unknown function (DUF4129)